MDGHRFDSLLLAITSSRSRRDALRLLTAAVATGGGLAQVHPAAAACLANGAPCDPNASPNGCCSGKCSRRRKRCQPAPGQSICTVEDDSCRGPATFCDGPGSPTTCFCYVTSRGYSFCSKGGECFPCKTDANCVKRRGGRRGDRCVVCPGCGPATSNRSCVSKCPKPVECTETVNCSGLDVQCGSWPGACGWIYCGDCPKGQTCNSEGFCV